MKTTELSCYQELTKPTNNLSGLRSANNTKSISKKRKIKGTAMSLTDYESITGNTEAQWKG